MLGVTYSELGLTDKAIEALEKAISIKPEYTDAYFNLGVTYGKLGAYDKASEVLIKAVRLRPAHAGAYYYLGIIHIIEMDMDSATNEHAVLKDLDRDLADRLYEFISK